MRTRLLRHIRTGRLVVPDDAGIREKSSDYEGPFDFEATTLENGEVIHEQVTEDPPTKPKAKRRPRKKSASSPEMNDSALFFGVEAPEVEDVP